MKKLIVIATLAASSAMAAEVAVYTNTGSAAKEITATVGGQAGYVGMTSGRTQDRLTVGREYEVAKLGKLTAFAGAEASFLRNTTGASGYAVSPFIGAEYPITKKVSAAVVVSKQYGQDRVKQFDGTTTVIGLRTNF